MADVLHVLTGPTAVGKTELSLRWAEARPEGADILSCDSLLVYRGMDIGTAKPTPEQRARVPHHGIDLCPPARQYSIVDYVAMARRVVEAVTASGRALLVTGGSGFYLKSFFAPVIDPVEVPARVAESVRALYREQGIDAVLARLKAVSPAGLGTLETRNPRRVIRALERCLASGRELPDLQEEFRRQPEPFAGFEKRVCLLTRSPDVLKARVRRRVEAMLEAGLVEEVERLRAEGIEANPSAAGAIGYRETLAFLENREADRESLARAITANTIGLLKKQRTWFRKQIPIHREIDLDREPEPLDLFDDGVG